MTHYGGANNENVRLTADNISSHPMLALHSSHQKLRPCRQLQCARDLHITTQRGVTVHVREDYRVIGHGSCYLINS
ncbi:hypothetical protein RRG08_053338 [Elysia crispata]|uniref:Uncharacterized protein n=1 Tax=Elysia crispata TaxID=231223 RepID=A0AAE0ZLY0_9GAST|nr:hypothetical protein RRG08_053338 [Elysia crispata]